MGELFGTAFSATSQIQAGRAQKRQMDFQAAMKAREARAIKQKALFDQKRQAKKAVAVRSALRTKLAGSGARMDVGAPLALQEEQAAELELENFLIGAEGEEGYKTAMLERKLLKRRGKSAAAASQYQAGGTLLKGFESAWS